MLYRIDPVVQPPVATDIAPPGFAVERIVALIREAERLGLIPVAPGDMDMAADESFF